MDRRIRITMIEAAFIHPLARDGTPIMAVFPHIWMPNTCHEIRWIAIYA